MEVARVIQQYYALGNIVRFEYDAMNNRIRECMDASGEQTCITLYQYDKKGRRIKEILPLLAEKVYNYDGNDNMISFTDEEGQETTACYDLNNRPTALAYSDGRTVSFRYNLRGDLVEMTDWNGTAAMERDILGRLVKVTDHNGRETGFAYDALGNRTGKSINGILKAAYQYNELNQLTAMTEDGAEYGYTYDRRGSLTQESRGGIPVRRYTYDTAGRMALGKNLESGEETLYAYNALGMRVGNTRRTGTGESLRTREVQYVPDFLGAAGNELMSYETGGAGIRHVFGRGYERLSRKVSGGPEGVPEKAYFQSDLYGSPLFATDVQGSLLQYAERGIWGDLKPGVEAVPGLEESLRFTSYSHDPVIGKYFAQARFYDSAGGRMLSMDPVKSGLNRYCYCDNDPVNYEDADGEFLHFLAPLAVGAVSHFVFHFAGSVVSQLMDGQKINWRQALGEGVNGGITGGVRMAAVSSGAGLSLMAGLDFVAGTLGDAAERWITDGEFNPRKSITSGLANAAGGRIYGNDPLKSAGSAFLRGFGSGAATSGINYISEFLGGMGQTGAGAYPGMPGMAGALVSGALSPYTNGRDPRSGCDSSGLPGQGLGYSAARGYQYSIGQGESPQRRKRNFDFGDFFQGMLTEGVTEGLSNAGSFGLGKVFDAVKRGIQGRKKRVPGGSRGGKATKITSNLGKEIDITPSTNHTTTTKNPGLKGTPNSSVDIVDSAGNIKTRRWFDSNGIQMRDVDFTNHGNAKLHPEWPHEHGAR